MADVAIIIGNGLDLDLGLPSKYSDFIKSPEWQAVVKKVEGFLFDESYRRHSLVAQLQKASKESLWFDIEEEIHKFVISHPTNSPKEIKFEFDLMRKALTDYLKRVSDDLLRKADKNRLAYKLLSNMQASPMSSINIYFNYTFSGSFLEKPTYYDIGKGFFTYVHGSLRDDDIVIGCNRQKDEHVNRDLSFMYKHNMIKKANHVARNLLEAKEIIFFGHSINEMDFCYFREFFKAASDAPNPIRHLTIITYDEESERNIKDNICDQGISVTDLYNNLWTFDVIHTKNVYEGDEEDIKRWNGMVDRLLAKDRHGV